MQQCSSYPFADPREVQRMLRDAIVEHVKLQHEFGTQSFAFGLVPERCLASVRRRRTDDHLRGHQRGVCLLLASS
jgi:hypothetical protein